MRRVKISHFLPDETGATAIEYALIAGSVSICIAAALIEVSGSLQGDLNAVAAGFQRILQ